MVTDAAEKYSTLTTRLDTTTIIEPSFRMIIISNCTYAYKREDGIYVVPIGCLGP